MKSTAKLVFVLFAMVALLGLSACKSDADKLVGMMEEMADIVDSNKGDCDKMGDALDKFAADNSDEMKELTKKMKDMPEAESKELKDKYKDRMDAAEKKMDGLGECIMNEKVMKAMEKLM